MMASCRGISNTLLRLSSLNSNLLSSQRIFCRGISSKLFVKGISFSTTEKTLAEAFSRFGEVIEAKIIMDKLKRRPKGYAYVTFTKEDEAEKALREMNGKLVDGRTVFVDHVQCNEGRSLIARGPPRPASDN